MAHATRTSTQSLSANLNAPTLAAQLSEDRLTPELASCDSPKSPEVSDGLITCAPPQPHKPSVMPAAKPTPLAAIYLAAPIKGGMGQALLQ